MTSMPLPLSPYIRETYRYTPLLVVLLLPNELIHASFGKYLFAACDLINGVLIYQLLVASILSRPTRAPAKDDAKLKLLDEHYESGATENTRVADTKTWAAFLAATHLLNPLVFSISTRGSSESVLCTLVLLTLHYALQHRWDAAAVMLGISTHWKIYPVIYGVSCVTAIAAQAQPTSGWGFPFAKSLLCTRTLRFAILSAGTFYFLGTVCYAMYVPAFFSVSFPPRPIAHCRSSADGDTRSCTKPTCIIQTASIIGITFRPIFTSHISPTPVNLGRSTIMLSRLFAASFVRRSRASSRNSFSPSAQASYWVDARKTSRLRGSCKRLPLCCSTGCAPRSTFCGTRSSYPF